MRATRINHISIVANALDESARFYEELFGMERIPTAKFPEPVLWLRAGTSQLHLFEADEDAPSRAPTSSFDVDDFDAVYAKAKEMGILDSQRVRLAAAHPPGGLGAALPARPGRQPVEVDWPDASTLSPETLRRCRRSSASQDGDAAGRDPVSPLSV